MSRIIDLISIVSVVGIWPRFIEPRLVKVTHLDWPLPQESAHLDSFRIVQFSDLHFHSALSDTFLDRVARRILRQKPDLILFTGDFICYSQLEDQERLKVFLNRLHAPHGCFCVFGNHDYARYVSLSGGGQYDVKRPASPLKGVARALWTVIEPRQGKYTISDAAAATPSHDGLCALLRETPFTLLENTTTTLPIGLNITGLGDHALGRCRPQTAFASYQRSLPGVVLSHNPDTFRTLLNFPGEWVLSGHTHGEQIHLPFCRPISRKLARLENPCYTRGLHEVKGKRLYVNRGIGGHKPFRLFSPPEVTVITGRARG